MSNGTENIKQPQINPASVQEKAAEPKESARAPSETARAIEAANSVRSHSVEYWTNDFKTAEVDGNRVEIFLDEAQDPEKVRPKAISYARHASFRRFENGGLTQGKAELPTHRREGTKEVRLDKPDLSNEEKIDQSLLVGISSLRTGRA